MRLEARTFPGRLVSGKRPICVAMDNRSSVRQLCRSNNAVATAWAYWRGGIRCGSPTSRTNISSVQSSSSSARKSLRFHRSPDARFANISSDADRERTSESLLSAGCRRLSGTVGVTVIPILIASAVCQHRSRMAASWLTPYRTFGLPSANIGSAMKQLSCARVAATADVDTTATLI